MENKLSSVEQLRQQIEALRSADPELLQARVGLQVEPDNALIPVLLETVDDKNDYVREGAVTALRAYREAAHPHVLSALTRALLDDPLASVRGAAAEALSHTPDAIPALLTALGDASAEVRVEVVFALHGMRASNVTAALTHLLHSDPDENVRRHACYALGKLRDVTLRDDMLQALADSSEAVRYEAVCALSNTELTGKDAQVVEGLMKRLSDVSARVRTEAAQSLVYSMPIAIPALMEALRDPEANVRNTAAYALGSLGATAARDALKELARSDVDSAVRSTAARVLADMRNLSAAPTLDRRALRFAVIEKMCKALQDPHADARAAAASQLGDFLQSDDDVHEYANAFQALCTALSDAALGVRTEAARALGRWGVLAAMTPLHQSLDAQPMDAQQSDPLRVAVGEAMTRIEETRALLIQQLTGSNKAKRTDAMIKLQLPSDQPIPQQMLDYFSDGANDLQSRCLMARVFVRRGNADVIPLLVKALCDKEAYLRWKVAYALIDLPDPRALRPLIACLEDQEQEVRANAALALAAIGDSKAIKPLKKLLRDESPYVRRRVVWALSFFDPTNVLPDIIECLVDDDEAVRSKAADAVIDLCDEGELEHILERVPDEFDDVRAELEDRIAQLRELDDKPVQQDASSCEAQQRSIRFGSVHYE